jgi:RNA polymerase sigma-70 factor (ECF subfamily)
VRGQLALAVGQPRRVRLSTRDDFEALLVPALDAAWGTALRLTGNAGDAEDLLQDASLLAWRGFGSFEPGSNFRAWFFRILTNRFFSLWRKQKRAGTTVELEEAPELYLYTRAEELGLQQTPDPAVALISRLDVEAVEAALAALPDEFREVCTLAFMQDLSYQEIADQMAIPVGTVRSRLHRGRRLLQQALWSVAEERGLLRGLGADSGEES